MKKEIFFLGFVWYFCVVGGYDRDDTLIGPYPYHIPINNNVLGIAYHAQSGLMVTSVARLRPGVPSAINAFCVADYDQGTSPYLWGFPDYEKNTLKEEFYAGGDQSRKLNKQDKYSENYYNDYQDKYYNDFSIISSYHPIVDDRCNRLFALDTGALYYGPNGPIYYVQNPSLIVFELPPHGCDTRYFPLSRRVEFPNHLWEDPIGFLYIALDYQPKGSCDDLFLYITNVFDARVIVYDYKRGDFWYFADPSFRPYMAEAYMVFNKNFEYYFPIAVTNLALGWQDKDGDRNAYYGPEASFAEYVVSTKLLKNSKKAPYKYKPGEFELIGYRGCRSQTCRQFFDLSSGVLFFAEIQSNRVRCWNTQLPLNPDTIGVVMESDVLQYVSEIFVDPEGFLWFHSCQLPLLFHSEIPLDITKKTSRSFRVRATDAIKGTVCDLSNKYYRSEFEFPYNNGTIEYL
uniref:Uncharacterized protein n=1 Tax=Phlebotomus papatasi TaxID=29031 RepID=A0A1B0DQX8_PHLPP